MSDNLLNPPTYCPDALATDVGWINPANGEILVLVKNLRKRIAERDAMIEWENSNKEILIDTPEPAIIEEEKTTISEVMPDPVPAPVKRGRGRPRKNPQ